MKVSIDIGGFNYEECDVEEAIKRFNLNSIQAFYLKSGRTIHINGATIEKIGD